MQMFDANDRASIITRGGAVYDALATNVTAYSESLDALVMAETNLRRDADALEVAKVKATADAIKAIEEMAAAGEKMTAPARDAYISAVVGLRVADAYKLWRESQSDKDRAEADVQANKRAIDASRAALEFLTAILTTTVPTAPVVLATQAR